MRHDDFQQRPAARHGHVSRSPIEGCPKEIGPGVFRDADGNIIPRERFSEDPNFDIPITLEEAYAFSVKAGVPRDFAAEENVDMDKVRYYLTLP